MTDAQFPPVPPPPTSWVTGSAPRNLPPQMPTLASLEAVPAEAAAPGDQYAQYAPYTPYAPPAPQPLTAPNQYAVETRPVTVPTLGALVPFAALLAIVGAFTPWFAPGGTLSGVTVLRADHALYSWKDGRIGLIAPIGLLFLGIGVIALMRGKTATRFQRGANPLSSAGNRTMIVSAISAAGLVAAWAFVPHQFTMPADFGGTWDGAVRSGVAMTRGPQFGFFLTVAAVVLAFVGGVALRRAGRRY